MIWEDTTSYSRGRERIPTTWTLRMPKGSRLVVTVTSSNIYYKPGWAVIVRPFDDEATGLDATDVADAQAKAVSRARQFLLRLTADFAAATAAD